MSEDKIYGNKIPETGLKSAERTFRSLAKRFSFDPNDFPALKASPMKSAYEVFGVKKLEEDKTIDKNSPNHKPIDVSDGVVLGCIRMGFGHYRIGMAIASAAHSMGLTPYWLDLMDFSNSAASQTIKYLEGLYNWASRLSQKSKFFDKHVWDKITSTAARNISYTARDRALSKIYEPIVRDLPKDAAFLSTHPWPGQAAVRSGIKNIVALIPDNLALAFHLVEGAVHTVQAPSLYMGYRTFMDMGGSDDPSKIMPDKAIRYVGAYVDHEIVSNIEEDCDNRLRRIKTGQTRRFLLSMGGAGAQAKRFADIALDCKDAINDAKVALFINMGDHKGRWEELKQWLTEEGLTWTMHSDWDETQAFVEDMKTKQVTGIHIFLHEKFFAAVYCTNILMRVCDVMITKPSELAVYPVPKLFIQHVGQHEVWGAIRSSELGDGTMETKTDTSLRLVLKLLIQENDLLEMYCTNIVKNYRSGIYNGAYEAVKIARNLQHNA